RDLGRPAGRDRRRAGIVFVMGRLRTVLGDVEPAFTPLPGLRPGGGPKGVGTVLPHEHLYCDLRPLEGREAVRDDPAAVEASELPLLAAAREAGVGLLVEPTPPGIG